MGPQYNPVFGSAQLLGSKLKVVPFFYGIHMGHYTTALHLLHSTNGAQPSTVCVVELKVKQEKQSVTLGTAHQCGSMLLPMTCAARIQGGQTDETITTNDTWSGSKPLSICTWAFKVKPSLGPEQEFRDFSVDNCTGGDGGVYAWYRYGTKH